MTEKEMARRFRETEAVWHIADLIEDAERGAWEDETKTHVVKGVRGAIVARLCDAFPSLDAQKTLILILEEENACLRERCSVCRYRANMECETLRIASRIVAAYPEIVPEDAA